jgi:hypothetical protein
MNLNICIQIKLFPNFHNKIAHLFFHHFCEIAVKSGRELATVTVATYLPYLPYLPYQPYLPSLPSVPCILVKFLPTKEGFFDERLRCYIKNQRI